MRLRRSACAGPGIERVRRGKKFAYLYADGSPVLEEDHLERITSLVLPPAWKDVWICPWHNGHVQAMGTDAAGRRQYRYHDEWRIQRDLAKHDRILEVAKLLPAARARVDVHLAQRGYSRDRVLGTAFRMLDLGFFRVGSEEYAEENNTYGLATLLRDHLTIRGDTAVFEYVAKGSKERVQSVLDPDVLMVLRGLKRRDDPNPELLAYRVAERAGNHGWHDVKSEEVNAYLREVVGTEMSAKDFRTWHATVLMSVGLAVSTEVPRTQSARKRAVSRAVTEVSTYLGNTPAVARKSYIDPRVIDLYENGVTVAPSLERLGADAAFGSPATHGQIEQAVLTMLTRESAKPTVRRKRTPAVRVPSPA